MALVMAFSKPWNTEGSSRVQQCVANAASMESSRFKGVAGQAVLPENNPSSVPLRIRRSTPPIGDENIRFRNVTLPSVIGLDRCGYLLFMLNSFRYKKQNNSFLLSASVISKIRHISYRNFDVLVLLFYPISKQEVKLSAFAGRNDTF
jgi:hypothetical protein